MPNLKKNIFNRKNLNFLLEKISRESISDLEKKLEILDKWVRFTQSRIIYSTKEVSLQGKFLDDIFSDVLGYKNRLQSTELWNLNQEQTTTINETNKKIDLMVYKIYDLTYDEVKIVDPELGMEEEEYQNFKLEG